MSVTSRRVEQPQDLRARAARINRESIVIDTVNRAKLDDAFFASVREGGVTVLGRTILVSSPDVFSPFGFMESLREIAQLHQAVREHSDRLVLVRSGADIQEAHSTGRVGIYVYFQSTEPLADQLWRLHLFHALGLRVLQLTYNSRSLAGDGNAERTDAGLSKWGIRVIQECNRLGIAVDVSHCGDRTSAEAIEISSTPVLITHANSRSLCHKNRCKRDEEVIAAAGRGGVVGVFSLPAFQSDDGTATLERMVDHIDHYVQLVGIDHVGLGLDLITGHERDNFTLLGYDAVTHAGMWRDGVQQTIPRMGTLADLPNITEELLRRGYSEDDIKKILGGNWARVLAAIWDGAVVDRRS